MDKLLIFLPTLNESKSASLLIDEINMKLSVDFLVIDDGSTDGTYMELINLGLSNLQIIQRGSRLGIGSAHLAALVYAKQNLYDFVLTMDADGTHRVVDVIRISQMRASADLVIGSRFAPGAKISDWSRMRIFLTFAAHFVTKYGLGLKHDSSSGLRCYRLSSFDIQLINSFNGVGYDFFFKSLHRIALQKKSILDIPVTLEARVLGNSKLTFFQASKSIAALIFKILEFRLKVLFARF